MPPHPGFYARASAFKAVGAFEIKKKVGGDFDWMVRFFYVQGLLAAPLGQPIVAMRMGGLSTSGLWSLRIINTEARQTLSRHKVRTTTALIWSKYLVKAGQLMATKGSFRVPESVRWKPD